MVFYRLQQAFDKGYQFVHSGGGVLGPVDRLQRRCEGLAVLVGNGRSAILRSQA